MSTARHSPRFPRVSVRMVKASSISLSLALSLVRPSLSSVFPGPLYYLFYSLLSIYSFSVPLSPSRASPVSAHRPRAHPPRLSGKPCCEPLTVTKVPTYKRGLIPARGNSRETRTWECPSGPPRHVHRENCEAVRGFSRAYFLNTPR
ncbi:hypothetical protein PUN28_009557 [Cardiocondyla obscurior]|uniref:Uncharacterized protein n=1 Tax=Cardiocondyla obscurior TaxID=286306 RepID=A0AAW2FT86_9HYME